MSPEPSAANVIALVGAGFRGTFVAAQLLGTAGRPPQGFESALLQIAAAGNDSIQDLEERFFMAVHRRSLEGDRLVPLADTCHWPQEETWG